MATSRLVLNDKQDFLTGQRFGDLDDDSRSFVLGALGLADLNPKTIVEFTRVSENEAKLEIRQLLTQEPTDRTVGVGETLYSKKCEA